MTSVSPPVIIKPRPSNRPLRPRILSQVKIDTPIPTSTSVVYEYNIDDTLTALKDIGRQTLITTINICIYRIVDKENRDPNIQPFLQYLLYKYPSTKEYEGMVFPFITYTKKHKSIKDCVNTSIKKITGSTLSVKGCILEGTELYVFYDLYEYKKRVINFINLKKRSDTYWWGLIDEICNHRKILTFPIHKSVYNIFYKNPDLIYLTRHNTRMSTPIVAYYGNYYEYLPIITTLGVKSHFFVNDTKSHRFGSYKKALRYGCWSWFYKKVFAFKRIITDIDGKYTKGGLVRFAVFMDNPFVPINISYERKVKLRNNPSWSISHQSSLISSVDFNGTILNIEPEYNVTMDSQYVSLSYHIIDSKGTTHWNTNNTDMQIG
jgi:hypothetical protein